MAVTYASEAERNELTELINSIPKYHLFRIEKIGRKYIEGILKFEGQPETCDCKILKDEAEKYLNFSSKDFQRIPKNIYKICSTDWK